MQHLSVYASLRFLLLCIVCLCVMNVFPVLAVDDFSVERGYRSSLNYTLSDVPQEDALGYKAKQTWSINSNAEDTSEFEASSVGPYSAWESLIGAS